VTLARHLTLDKGVHATTQTKNSNKHSCIRLQEAQLSQRSRAHGGNKGFGKIWQAFRSVNGHEIVDNY
jgi:hypothetical protein